MAGLYDPEDEFTPDMLRIDPPFPEQDVRAWDMEQHKKHIQMRTNRAIENTIGQREGQFRQWNAMVDADPSISGMYDSFSPHDIASQTYEKHRNKGLPSYLEQLGEIQIDEVPDEPDQYFGDEAAYYDEDAFAREGRPDLTTKKVKEQALIQRDIAQSGAGQIQPLQAASSDPTGGIMKRAKAVETQKDISNISQGSVGIPQLPVEEASIMDIGQGVIDTAPDMSLPAGEKTVWDEAGGGMGKVQAAGALAQLAAGGIGMLDKTEEIDAPNYISDMLGMAGQGASMGATFGPWGAAIGGVIGAGTGLIKAKTEDVATNKKIAQREEQKRRFAQARSTTQVNPMFAQKGGKVDPTGKIYPNLITPEPYNVREQGFTFDPLHYTETDASRTHRGADIQSKYFTDKEKYLEQLQLTSDTLGANISGTWNLADYITKLQEPYIQKKNWQGKTVGEVKPEDQKKWEELQQHRENMRKEYMRKERGGANPYVTDKYPAQRGVEAINEITYGGYDFPVYPMHKTMPQHIKTQGMIPFVTSEGDTTRMSQEYQGQGEERAEKEGWLQRYQDGGRVKENPPYSYWDYLSGITKPIASKATGYLSNIGEKIGEGIKQIPSAIMTAGSQEEADIEKGMEGLTPKQQLEKFGITKEQSYKQNWFQKKLHQNLTPYGYSRPAQRVLSAIQGKKPPSTNVLGISLGGGPREDIYNLYMGKPQKGGYVGMSQYKGANNQEQFIDKSFEKYITSRTHDWAPDVVGTRFNKKVGKLMGVEGKTAIAHVDSQIMGRYTESIKEDEKGKYYEYRDVWDINPSPNRWPKGSKERAQEDKRKTQKQKEKFDYSEYNVDFGKPVHLYNRIYFDEVKDKDGKIEYVPREEEKTQEYQDGGKIQNIGLSAYPQIEPRGSLTAEPYLKYFGSNLTGENLRPQDISQKWGVKGKGFLPLGDAGSVSGAYDIGMTGGRGGSRLSGSLSGRGDFNINDRLSLHPSFSLSGSLSPQGQLNTGMSKNIGLKYMFDEGGKIPSYINQLDQLTS